MASRRRRGWAFTLSAGRRGGPLRPDVSDDRHALGLAPLGPAPRRPATVATQSRVRCPLTATAATTAAAPSRRTAAAAT